MHRHHGTLPIYSGHRCIEDCCFCTTYRSLPNTIIMASNWLVQFRPGVACSCIGAAYCSSPCTMFVAIQLISALDSALASRAVVSVQIFESDLFADAPVGRNSVIVPSRLRTREYFSISCLRTYPDDSILRIAALCLKASRWAWSRTWKRER